MLAFLLLVASTAAAQQRYDLNRFGGLKSEGEMPADLRKSLAQLYSEDKQRVRDYNDGHLANRDRVLEASYHINRLMANGRILYGDPISRMVERIADTLLKDYPELRKELRFYTVKSSAVNAFATGQGMIFVTTGLVAQAENESQLAFIISHEIVHYYRKHNMEMLSRKVKNNDDEEAQTLDFLLRHHRSREMENEADSLGLRLFYINSPYDKQVTDGVFDVLQYAQQPFDEVPFDTLYFNTPYYKLPSHYRLAKVADITSRDDYDDSRSTHPNIKKRRARTGEILAHCQGGSPYVVTTPDGFAHLRTLARFECIRQDLVYGHYTRAFYNSYLLEQQYPNNPFLTRSKTQAFYGIAMYKTYYSNNTIVGDYQDYEGEIQQLYYMLGKLTAEEASLLAMRECWKLHLQLPDDPQAMAMAYDMMRTLRDKHNLSRGSFSATYDTTSTSQAVENDQPVANQKYARIRQKQQRSATAPNQPRFVFTDFLMQNGDFRRFMDDCFDNPPPADTTNWTARSAFLYAPQYVVVDNKKDPDILYRKSDRMERRLISEVQQAAQAAGISLVDFSDPAMHNHTDAQFYNDFVALNEWTNEFWHSRGNVPMVLSTQPLMDSLNLRYNADKLSLNMAVNNEYRQSLYPLYFMAVGVMMAPSLPLFAYHYGAHTETTRTRNVLVDTRRGRVLADESKVHDYADHHDLVTADIYNAYQQALHPSRTPGFLGRRLAVSAQMGVGFPIMNYLFDRKGAKIDLRPAVNMEWVTARKQSLSLFVDYNKSLFFVDKGYLISSSGWGSYGNLYNTTLLSGALTYRWYNGSTTAPLGAYFGVGTMASRVQLQPQAEKFKTNYLDSTYYRFGLDLETGRNYLIANRLLLNMGVRYVLTVANPFKDDGWDVLIPTDADILEKTKLNARRQMNADVWMANLVMVHIGLGFLPF